MKQELNGLWSWGMRALFTCCQGDVPEKGKNGYISWKWLLRYSSQSFHIWLVHWFSELLRHRETAEYFGLLWEINHANCCQECRAFVLLVMVNQHPLHPVIENIHSLTTTCLRTSWCVLKKIAFLSRHSPQGQVPSWQPRAASLKEL